MPCHVMSCHVMSCHIHHVCHVMTYSCMSYHVMSCHIHHMSCHVMTVSFMLPFSCHVTRMHEIMSMCNHLSNFKFKTKPGPPKTVRIRRFVSCSHQSQWVGTSPSQAWLSHPCPTSWSSRHAWLQPAPVQLLRHRHQLPWSNWKSQLLTKRNLSLTTNESDSDVQAQWYLSLGLYSRTWVPVYLQGGLIHDNPS